MYKLKDFEPGDVVLFSGSYSSYLEYGVVIKTTPKMVKTSNGIKMPSAVGFVPIDRANNNSVALEIKHFQRRYPDIQVKFKVKPI